MNKGPLRYDVYQLGWDPIHVAAFNGNCDKLSSIFKELPFHNPQARDGKRPLHIAVAQTSTSLINVEVIPLLLSNNNAINAQDNQGVTALHVAAGGLSRNTRSTSVLLSKTGVVHCPATASQSQSSLRTVSLLTGVQELNLEATDNEGRTALLTAASVGNVAVIHHLLSLGASVEARDREGRTSLHLSSGSCCDDDAAAAAQILLAAGCSLEDVLWSQGTRPDEIAAAVGHKTTTRMLVNLRRNIGRQRRSKYKRAQSYISKGDTVSFKTLLDNPVEREQLIHFHGGTRGATLLLDAVKHDRVEMVKSLLLSWGADLKATTKTGSNLLHVAARSNSAAVVLWLHREASSNISSQAVPVPVITWSSLRNLCQAKNDMGLLPSDLLKHDAKNSVELTESMLLLCQRATENKNLLLKGDMSGSAKRRSKVPMVERESTAMWRFLEALNLESHYDGLVEDGWTTMERLTLIDDREELKSAGFTRPGDIKLLLKTLEKERLLMAKILEKSNESSERSSYQHTQLRSSTMNSTTTTTTSSSSAAEFAMNEELSIDYHELDMVTMELGRGSFGIVHRCKWRGMDVAVKCLIKSDTVESQHEVYREARMMRRVNNHYAILRLVGIVNVPPGSLMDTSPRKDLQQMAIVTEYCERGNLQQLFYVNDPLCIRKTLGRADTLRMIMDAAAGVLHLHSANVIHRDLACRNLLADDKLRVFVADFGFARVKERSRGGDDDNTEGIGSLAGYSTNNIGPIRWEAPEVWKSEGVRKYSRRTDVYSFG